jgi:transcriptional regulator with XRE-family HTH domain
MEQLKRLRRERGLSQAKLAALADIDPSTMNQIERGAREPTTATLRKLAAALDVSLAELLEESETLKAGRRSSLEPSFNDVLAEERRLSRFAEAIVAAASRWGEAMADADTDDHKRFGLIEAALALNGVISERAEQEHWEALPNRERLEIVTAMEKLTEAAERGLAHLKASHESRTQEEQVEQRREQIRELTRRISA